MLTMCLDSSPETREDTLSKCALWVIQGRQAIEDKVDSREISLRPLCLRKRKAGKGLVHKPLSK